MDEKNKQGGLSLLEKVKNTPTEKLINNIKKSDGINDEDIERHKKLLDCVKKDTNNKYIGLIQLAFTWCSIAALVCVTIYGIYFLYQKKHDLLFAESLLSYFKDSILLIFSTLFVNEKIHRKKKNKI